jgi:hypothetical protein
MPHPVLFFTRHGGRLVLPENQDKSRTREPSAQSDHINSVEPEVVNESIHVSGHR